MTTVAERTPEDIKKAVEAKKAAAKDKADAAKAKKPTPKAKPAAKVKKAPAKKAAKKTAKKPAAKTKTKKAPVKKAAKKPRVERVHLQLSGERVACGIEGSFDFDKLTTVANPKDVTCTTCANSKAYRFYCEGYYANR